MTLKSLLFKTALLILFLALLVMGCRLVYWQHLEYWHHVELGPANPKTNAP